MHDVTYHQKNQIKIINQIEQQIRNQSLSFSTVTPTENYENDKRKCLTSVHLPNKNLTRKIREQITEPLQKIEPTYYWYKNTSLHLTIKNVRVINNPPHFSKEEISKVGTVFNKVIPRHTMFNIYFYRLLLFPNNLALIGTTDSELDAIHSDLDNQLNHIGVPDDKVYLNSKHFFLNMTLCRFNTRPGNNFIEKVQATSNSINWSPYEINSVSLLTCNAVLKNKNIINTWNLKSL